MLAQHHNESHHQRNKSNQNYCKPPLNKEHSCERADKSHYRNKDILGTVMGKLRYVKKIRCAACHEFTCTRFVVEAEAHLLKMCKSVTPHIRLHRNAELMTIEGDDVRRNCPQYIEHKHYAYQHKELPEHRRFGSKIVVKYGS